MTNDKDLSRIGQTDAVSTSSRTAPTPDSHSPLPWHIRKPLGERRPFDAEQIDSADRYGVAGCQTYAIDDSNTTNAAFIVRCVNSHDALVAALKAICDDAIGELRDPLWIVRQELILKASAALAKAEATQ